MEDEKKQEPIRDVLEVHDGYINLSDVLIRPDKELKIKGGKGDGKTSPR